MSLTVQFETMISMIALGCVFGALLDTYRRFWKRSVRSRWMTFIWDIFFWCLYGGLLFYCLYHVNNGEIRFYLFIALLCGFSAYQALFKKLYENLLETIILFFVKIFLLIKKLIHIFIVWPIRTIVTVVINIVQFIGKMLMMLAKVGYQLLLFVLKVIFWPITIIWRLFPKKVRKKANDLYAKLAGHFLIFKNKLLNTIKRWKNK
ncbi:spore cortex biosynthesis protein YabQ [Bacillus ectoiniformans]|uniref:spore cortex biosynthesis protein YabQ n=1 Tax=Bacillus ectoiniformans TaxID=1494429 RepID=UPI00195CEAC5|nr:spore cortex biosynthesis protein YabQ [Bacillus ectoiniformans]MBM7650293.1 spore cortex biosynthesis protein YabQ [Bacillus ectoiniformans]